MHNLPVNLPAQFVDPGQEVAVLAVAGDEGFEAVAVFDRVELA